MSRFYILLFLIISLSACGQSKNKIPHRILEKFRTGEYYYDTLGFHCEIIRDKVVQIERYKLKGVEYEMVFKIFWESDSVYILELKKSNIPGCLNIGDKLRNVILHADKNDIFSVRYTTKNCGTGNVQIIRK